MDQILQTMVDLGTWIQAHPYLTLTVLAYVLFSNAVAAMDEPTPQDTRAYRFWYKFLHLLANNYFGLLLRKFQGK